MQDPRYEIQDSRVNSHMFTISISDSLMRFTDGQQQFSIEHNCQINDLLTVLFNYHPKLR